MKTWLISQRRGSFHVLWNSCSYRDMIYCCRQYIKGDTNKHEKGLENKGKIFIWIVRLIHDAFRFMFRWIAGKNKIHCYRRRQITNRTGRGGREKNATKKIENHHLTIRFGADGWVNDHANHKLDVPDRSLLERVGKKTPSWQH